MPSSRDLAREWAVTVRRSDALYLGLRTSRRGLDVEILEIGAVDGDGNVLLDTVVQPCGSPPLGFTASDIDQQLVAHASTWPEVYFQLGRLFLEYPAVISYHAAVGRRVLAQTCRRHGLPPLVANWHCAMLQYAAYVGEWNAYKGGYRWHDLPRATAELGLSPLDGRARDEAEACRGVVLAIALTSALGTR